MTQAGPSEELTPLLRAARGADPAELVLLLGSGHNVAETDAHGWTCVHHLCASIGPSELKTECLQVLVRHGADIEARSSASLEVGLHVAAGQVRDQHFLAQMLLSVRETAARDALGRTALHHVALAGHAADVHTPPQQQPQSGAGPLLLTPLAAALPAEQEQLAMQAATLLLRHGAVDARDLDAHRASAASLAEAGGQPQLAALLRRAEAAAARAARRRCRRLVQPLLLCGALGAAHAGCMLFTLPALPSAWPCAVLAALLAVLALSGARAGGADPGYLRAQRASASGAPPSLAATTGGGGAPPACVDPSHCFTCGLSRPLRAKHCRACDRCVRDFDHHCPWLNNCIGRRNRGAFYVFVTSLLLDTAVLAALGLFAVLRPAPPHHHSSGGAGAGEGWLCTAAPRACVAYAALPTTARHMQWALFAGAAAITVPLAFFWSNRTRNLLRNLTTNEWHNRKRYPHFKRIDGSYVNPFDRGTCVNCHTFFCAPAHAEAEDGLLASM